VRVPADEDLALANADRHTSEQVSDGLRHPDLAVRLALRLPKGLGKPQGLLCEHVSLAQDRLPQALGPSG
ncbi:unnamed protein product, partial [marine sediment metagenome]